MEYQPMSDIPPQGVEPGVSAYRKFLAGFTIVQCIGGAMMALLGAWLNSFGKSGFSWDNDHIFKFHPLFMTVGLVFLNSKAMLMYRMLRNKPKLPVKIAHGCFNLLSIAMTITGLVVVIKHKNDVNYVHFYSVHSWIGIGTFSLFVLQWVAGFLVFLYPGGSPPVRAAALKMHRFMGAAIFVLACVSVFTGVVTLAGDIDNYDQLPWSGRVLNAFSMTLVLFGLGVFMLLSMDEFRRPVS